MGPALSRIGHFRGRKDTLDGLFEVSDVHGGYPLFFATAEEQDADHGSRDAEEGTGRRTAQRLRHRSYQEARLCEF